MVQFSEHINDSNHKINSYDQITKAIVNLVSNKCQNKNNPTCQLSCLQNSLLMRIFDTPQKYLPNVDWKSYIRKVRTYSVSSSSTLFSCSIRAIYNRVNRSQQQRLSSWG